MSVAQVLNKGKLNSFKVLPIVLLAVQSTIAFHAPSQRRERYQQEQHVSTTNLDVLCSRLPKRCIVHTLPDARSFKTRAGSTVRRGQTTRACQWLRMSADYTSSSRLSPPIIACNSRDEVERAAGLFVHAGDAVLALGVELNAGGDMRAVAEALARAAGASAPPVRLLNLCPALVKNPSDRASTSHVEGKIVAPGGVAPAELDFTEVGSPYEWQHHVDIDMYKNGVLMLEVGRFIGSDMVLETLALLHSMIDVIHPRTVLVKSPNLALLARRMVCGTRLVADTNPLESLPERVAPRGHPALVATKGVSEYRRTIPLVVRPDDIALEIGCQGGKTTNLLDVATAGGAVGVDVSSASVMRARSLYETTVFEVANAWRTRDLLRVLARFGAKRRLHSGGAVQDDIEGPLADVVYVDIGGLSGDKGILSALALLDGLGSALEPRAIVIKSAGMRKLSTQIRSFGEIWLKANAKRTDEEPLDAARKTEGA